MKSGGGELGEWTYEGDRKHFVSSSRRGVPVTVQTVCQYGDERMIFINLGGTAGLLSVLSHFWDETVFLVLEVKKCFCWLSDGELLKTVNIISDKYFIESKGEIIMTFNKLFKI